MKPTRRSFLTATTAITAGLLLPKLAQGQSALPKAVKAPLGPDGGYGILQGGLLSEQRRFKAPFVTLSPDGGYEGHFLEVDGVYTHQLLDGAAHTYRILTSTGSISTCSSKRLLDHEVLTSAARSFGGIGRIFEWTAPLRGGSSVTQLTQVSKARLMLDTLLRANVKGRAFVHVADFTELREECYRSMEFETYVPNLKSGWYATAHPTQGRVAADGRWTSQGKGQALLGCHGDPRAVGVSRHVQPGQVVFAPMDLACGQIGHLKPHTFPWNENSDIPWTFQPRVPR